MFEYDVRGELTWIQCWLQWLLSAAYFRMILFNVRSYM